MFQNSRFSSQPALKSPPKTHELCSSSAGVFFRDAHDDYDNSYPVISCPTSGHTSPSSATSEGESYLRFARAIGLLPSADMFTRVTIEDAALDSFQNVLFSIARFRELTGVYPKRITVVGHDFKRRRFEGLHRLALRWPKLRFTYEGVPLGSEADEREAAAGEVRFSQSSGRSPHLISQLYLSCPTRFHHILRTCMAATHSSPKNAQDGTSTCGVMAIMLAPQNCASCWSGVQRMASRFSLGRCRGEKSNLSDTSDD